MLGAYISIIVVSSSWIDHILGHKSSLRKLISDKIDFKTKAVKRDKEGHYIMIKGSIQEEDITIINIYAPNIGAPQYVRQMLISIKGEINNTIIVGDYNNPTHTYG